MYGDQRLPEIKVQTVKCLSNTEHSLVLLERSCDTLPEQRDAGEYSSQHQKGKFFIQYVLKLRIKPNPRPARSLRRGKMSKRASITGSVMDVAFESNDKA